MKKINKNRKKRLFVVACILVASGLCAGGWLYWQKHNSDQKKSGKDSQLAGPTPADAGNNNKPAPVDRNGGIIDTSKDEPADVPAAGEGMTSESGKITVYQPASGSLIKSGDVISGKAKTSNVSFRLIDDAVGVVGMGSLKVIDGKFSGKFSFQSQGRNGRLDIFNTLSDGREVDIIEIPVKLK